MSGYLQRLVDTASGRRGSVHPRTGSIFSPPDIPLQGWGEMEQVAAEPSTPRTRATSRAIEPPEPPRRERRRSGHLPLVRGPVALDSNAVAHASPSPLGPAPH